MPSPADIAAFQGLLVTLSTAAASSVAALSTEQAAVVYPQVIAPYVAAAGTLSAQWYHDLAPKSLFVVEHAPPPPTDALFASARWAATQADPAQALSLATERRVFNQSRDTVALNASREGVKYSRYASANACDWCHMLAGRGAVYHTAEDAAASHDGCHCVAVPQRAGDNQPVIAPVAAPFDDTLHTAAVNAQGRLGDKFPDLRVDLHGVPDQGVVQISDTLDRLLTKYPALVDQLGVVEVGKVDGMAIAQTSGWMTPGKSIITLSDDWFSDWKPGVVATGRSPLEVAYADALARGHFYPAGPDEQAFSAVLTHELGHVMDGLTEGNTSDAAEDLLTAMWSKQGGYLTGTFSDYQKVNLSGYSYHRSGPDHYAILKPIEAVAEAFEDVEMNGPKARAASRTLYDRLIQEVGSSR